MLLNCCLSRCVKFVNYLVSFLVIKVDKEIDLIKEDSQVVINVNNNYSGEKFFETGMMTNGKVVHVTLNAIVKENYTLGDVIEKAYQYENQEMSKNIVDNEKLKKWECMKGSKK